MVIKHMIPPREKDLGGFSVRRILPFARQRMVGPWIFFDHMGPAEFPAGKGIDVRPHPHINLATVTYLFEGEILHRDSLGSVQAIRPGDINLMVAGKGITHSERERQAVRSRDHLLHGLQLWHALPEELEEIDPAFYHYPADTLPCIEEAGVKLRVMMGTAYGVTSPVKTFANTLYIESFMQKGDRLSLPKAEELAVYVAAGTITVSGQAVPCYHMAVLEDGETAELLAISDAQIAVIGGEKFSERFVEWNFVSSRKARIEQAREDWRAGRFPPVPGDEEEFIPLPM
jgi:hypothetical protein